MSTPSQKTNRALGAVIGPEGAFSARFPEPGHGGEATDDTQMAVLVGESLLGGGLELPDVFRRFQRWAAAEPKDIGLQTEAVLGSGDPWDTAAVLHFQVSQRAAGNGALMWCRSGGWRPCTCHCLVSTNACGGHRTWPSSPGG